jgi:hypothetical protein
MIGAALSSAFCWAFTSSGINPAPSRKIPAAIKVMKAFERRLMFLDSVMRLGMGHEGSGWLPEL